MANYRMSIQSNMPQERLFKYMATFSNAVEWDPEVASARGDDPGQLGLGSLFHLDLRVRKGTTPFIYKIVEFESPSCVVLEAITKTFFARDTIKVHKIDDKTSELDYEATLRMRGFAAILNGLLFIPFRRVGKRAKRGLEAVLASS